MITVPTYESYKNMLMSRGSSIGDIRKSYADMVMESTWGSDIQSKICYIYDYFHDDSPWLAKGMTYDDTTKTKIDAKFIVTQYNTLSKDQVEFHLMFKPSQPVSFYECDELFYYEKDFVKRYGAEFPIGLYCDIPDDRGIYRKWLICSAEYGNQFIKYSVLPCTYYLHWIEERNGLRFKRKMWVSTRSQNS